jgi:hypothetical protein
MKKMKIFYVVCLVVIVVGLTGCGGKKEQAEKIEKYDLSKVTSINGVDFKIVENDYKEITQILDKIKFEQDKIEATGKYTPLYVNYHNGLYAYAIYENGIIRCTKGEKVFYATDNKKAEQLLTTIKQLDDKYSDQNVYEIEYKNTYSKINGATLIDLKNGNSMIKLVFNKDIKNLRVISLKEEDEAQASEDEKVIVEDKTLNYMNEVSAQTTVVIKYCPDDFENGVAIKFENEYGYRYVITTTNESDNISFVTKIVG